MFLSVSQPSFTPPAPPTPPHLFSLPPQISQVSPDHQFPGTLHLVTYNNKLQHTSVTSEQNTVCSTVLTSEAGFINFTVLADGGSQKEQLLQCKVLQQQCAQENKSRCAVGYFKFHKLKKESQSFSLIYYNVMHSSNTCSIITDRQHTLGTVRKFKKSSYVI